MIRYDARAAPRGLLCGQRVSITGRLASMTRLQAIERIGLSGGSYVTTPDQHTDMLVVGLEGWPLRKDGRLTHSLHRARELRAAGAAIRVASEVEFMAALGLEGRQDDLHRLYTTEQLSRILEVEVAEIRSWVRSGLIRPQKVVRRLCYFDFRQVASAKALLNLMRAGATPARIRKSLEQLQSWLPGTEISTTQLQTLEQGGPVLVRLHGGQLAEPCGQLRLDFRGKAPGQPTAARELFTSGRRAPHEWFTLGVRAEEEGDLEQAARHCHQALLTGGPQAEIAFNLGNVLHGLGRPGEAVQRFMQAVEIEPDYVEAWNNLGNTLAELDRFDEALVAYERALLVEPAYADAHFNLAETLEQLGRRAAARPHWEAYLVQDPDSSEAAYVQKRLRD